jgi:hypothetical protein
MRKYQLYVFCSDRGPMTAESCHTLNSRLGERAGMAFLVHLHQWVRLRFGPIRGALQAYLCHKLIHNTVRYTELTPIRFWSLSAGGVPDGSATFNSFGLLFDIAVGIELFEVGPKVVDLLIVLDAGENHFRARDFGLGILDVFPEGRLIPDDARILVGIGILVIRDATGLAAVQAILCRTDFVLRARTDAMADQTFLKRDFALGDILRHSCVRRRGN